MLNRLQKFLTCSLIVGAICGKLPQAALADTIDDQLQILWQYNNNKQFKAALPYFDRLMKLNLGTDFVQARSPWQGVKCFNAPKKVAVLDARAASYEGLEQYQKALADRTEELRLLKAGKLGSADTVHLGGGYVDYSSTLSMTITAIGQDYFGLKQYKKAIDYFTEALTKYNVKGLGGVAYMSRAQAYEKIGKPDLAAKDKAEYAKWQKGLNAAMQSR